MCGVFQSGGTGGAPVWGRDVGIVSSYREVDIGGPRGFFAVGDEETGKEATGWYLEAGRVQECSESGE